MQTVIVTYQFVVEVENPEDFGSIAEVVEEYVNSVSYPFDSPVDVEVVD